MARRTITALFLLALILPAIYFGGLIYFLYAAAFVVVATWEYVQLFRAKDLSPSLPIALVGVLLILAARAFWPARAGAALTACILAAMTVHLMAYERGRDQAALDFGLTAAGIAYLGWVGAYLLDLRNLPDGGWWVVLVFAVVWIADSIAYFVGVRYGSHKMSPRLSPKKSWEGYFSGLIGGTLCGGLLALAFARLGPLRLSFSQGASLGFMLSAATTLGDLGESLFKRFVGAKDSGALLPGHGGAFDRIDSLIWAAVLGYYWIWLFLL
jgi:phosphatidate cytidylyltransferase